MSGRAASVSLHTTTSQQKVQPPEAVRSGGCCALVDGSVAALYPLEALHSSGLDWAFRLGWRHHHEVVYDQHAPIPDAGDCCDLAGDLASEEDAATFEMSQQRKLRALLPGRMRRRMGGATSANVEHEDAEQYRQQDHQQHSATDQAALANALGANLARALTLAFELALL